MLKTEKILTNMNIHVGINFVVGREYDFYFPVEVEDYDENKKTNLLNCMIFFSNDVMPSCVQKSTRVEKRALESLWLI